MSVLGKSQRRVRDAGTASGKTETALHLTPLRKSPVALIRAGLSKSAPTTVKTQLDRQAPLGIVNRPLAKA